MGRKWQKAVALAAMTCVVSCLGLWIGIHKIPWLGPLLADTGRAVAGPAAVARIEDTAYGVEDWWKRTWLSGSQPEALWQIPEATAAPPPPPAPLPVCSTPETPPPRPALQRKAVGRIHPDFGAQGDGDWIPMQSLRWPDEPPRLYKTLLHPDRTRPWTAVAVVAMDLPRVDLHLVAGRYVPEATEVEGKKASRPAIIPKDQQPNLIAAFNGGFKTIHGRSGMHVDGVTFISAQPASCTIAKLDNGRIEIGTWESRLAQQDALTWWRQTPACLMENGEYGEGVLSDRNINWGTSVHGSTFIRRSAIGIDKAGDVLFLAIGDSVSARLIAKALHHAGALDVAQLDVNWTLPKFLTYDPHEPGADRLEPTPLYEGLKFTRNEYVRERSPRDFFYVTRREN